MANRDVKIKIGGDVSEGEATIGDLKRYVNKSFEEMKKTAESESKEISNAFKRMGIRTEKEIKESTEKAKKNYRKIKESGTASANDIKRAHNQMTRKIESNNRELVVSNKKFGKSFSGLKTPITAAVKTVAVLSAAVAAVGVALGVKAFGESVKFEGAVLDLQKVLGDTEGKASDFIETATKLSEEFGIDATEVLAGATAFKQAGFDIKDAFDLQRIAIETSIAGGITVEEASQKIIASLKGFGLAASEAGRLTDIWNAVSNKFGTNTAELATGMAEFSPIAKLVGLSLEETAGFLTPVIEVFGSGSEAAQAFKTAMLRLADPTAKMKTVLEGLGIATEDQNGDMREIKEVALEVGESFRGMTKEQAAHTAAILFGKEQAGKMSTAFTNMSVVMGVTDVALDATGSRVDEVAIRMGSADKQIDISKTKFNNMARVLGDEFKDELTGVITEAGNLATKFKELVEGGGLDPILENVKPMLDNLKEGIADLSKYLPGFVNALGIGLEFVVDVASRIIVIAGRIGEALKLALVPFSLLGKGIGWLADKVGAEGGFLDSLTSSAQSASAPKGFRTGGIVRAQQGQFLPGYGGGDRVPVLAEAGEFVLRKEAVKALGVNTVAAINRMDMSRLISNLSNAKVQKFQEGGLVQEPGRDSVNVNLLLDGKKHTMSASRETADSFLNDIRALNIIHGRGKRPY